MTNGRRAIAFCRVGCDGSEIERLVRAHGLRVVHTVYADTGPELSARIAVQHALDHGAEVVVVPHLSDQEARETLGWRVATCLVDLLTSTGPIDRWSEPGRLPLELDPETTRGGGE